MVWLGFYDISIIESYLIPNPLAEMELVYSTASADCASLGEFLPLCRDGVGVFYSLS